jgi:hypothetical protein
VVASPVRLMVNAWPLRLLRRMEAKWLAVESLASMGSERTTPGIVILLDVSLLRLPDSGQYVTREILDLGLSDQTMVPLLVSLSILGSSSWNTWGLEGSAGGTVLHLPRQHHGSWWSGAARSQRQALDDGCAQGGGAVWLMSTHASFLADSVGPPSA